MAKLYQFYYKLVHLQYTYKYISILLQIFYFTRFSKSFQLFFVSFYANYYNLLSILAVYRNN